MGYKSLREHLLNSPNIKPAAEPVNEVLLTLIAASVLAYTCKPLLDTDFMKSIGGGIGMMFGGIGSIFGLGRKMDGDKDDDKSKKPPKNKRSNDDDDHKLGNKNDEHKSNSSEETNNAQDDKKPSFEIIQSVCSILAAKKLGEEVEKAKKTYDDDPSDKNKKSFDEAKKNHSTFLTSAFDENGNPRPAKEVADNLIKAYGLKDKDELAKKLGTDKVTIDDFNKNIKSACSDWVDKDGNVDEEKVKAAHDKLSREAKDAHVAAKKQAEDDAKAERDRKDKEAATKAERDKNREEGKKNEKPKDDSDKNTDAKKADRLKQIEDKWTKASEEVEELEKKLKDAKDDEKKDIESKLEKKKKLVSNLENAQKKLDDKSEKEYVVKHNGKETTIVKRPKKVGDGSTWCYKNDPDQTIAPDQARAMLKASGVKEGLTLAEWLTLFLD